jgi:uncharacterized protein YdhG (YjbR/CyaY superfamily)
VRCQVLTTPRQEPRTCVCQVLTTPRQEPRTCRQGCLRAQTPLAHQSEQQSWLERHDARTCRQWSVACGLVTPGACELDGEQATNPSAPQRAGPKRPNIDFLVIHGLGATAVPSRCFEGSGCAPLGTRAITTARVGIDRHVNALHALGRDDMNADWHKNHVLPKGTSLEGRIAWHREHQKRCACRPIPPKLLDRMRRDPAIDEYLASMNPKGRAVLQKLRNTIHALVPEVEECISYRMPAFRLGGKVIAGFAATSTGCSYYPFSGTTLTTLADDVQAYVQTRGALHFGPEKPLPASLVRKLLRARIDEGERRPGRKRT